MQRIQTAWRQSLPDGIPNRHLSVLLLGVTPEFAQFSWAPNFHLTALDSSAMMIRAVWPGDAPGRIAREGDWLAMPLPDASFDLILSDCGLVVVPGTALFGKLEKELRRVLKLDGRVVIRHFARPVQAESLADIAHSVAAGEVRNFNELKLRLLMSLHGVRPEIGVALQDAFDAFNRWFPDRATLAAQIQCSPEIVATIDAYRERQASYTFPNADEVAGLFPTFTLTVGPAGRYGLAECCPVFALAPRS